MAKMTFPSACARLKNYFLPMGFEAVLDSPSSMTVRVFDTQTGENFAVVAGLPWSAAVTNKDLVDIIGAIEQQMELQQFVHVPIVGDSMAGG